MSWAEVVRIPADVEQPDKIVWGFTARQVVILGVTGSILYLGYMTFGERIPLTVCAGLALPITVLGILLAVGTHDGISLDRFALAAIRHQRFPKHLVAAADVPAAPTWMAVRSGPLPALLKLPARGVIGDGLVDLGPDGVAAVAEVSTVSFALRTPDEQDALVAVFGRWLNSLSGPVQILVRATQNEDCKMVRIAGEISRMLEYELRKLGGNPQDILTKHEREHPDEWTPIRSRN